MKARKSTAIFSVVCYAVFVLAGIVLFGLMLWTVKNNNEEGWASVGLAFAAALMMILGVIYAAVGVIPLILKGVYLAFPKKIFPILCLPFDVFYLLFNAVMLISGISEGVWASVALFLAFMVISVLSLILNIKQIAYKQSSPKGGE